MSPFSFFPLFFSQQNRRSPAVFAFLWKRFGMICHFWGQTTPEVADFDFILFSDDRAVFGADRGDPANG